VKYIDSAGQERLTLHNPFDDTHLTDQVHAACEEDINKACLAAAAARKSGPWSRFTGAQRSACLLRVAALMEANAEKLAHLESLPTGRPISGIIHFDIKHMVEVFRCTLEF
jgi:aldehyde dehydrogenase (NAD+)